ncbi:MAG: hypothetical protein RLZZ558_531 [Planctomycetota bacterium]|jgi:pyrroline-5-carboxylate reductase
MRRLAVAGFGKLGSALVQGALQAGVVRAADVVVWARSEQRRRQAESMGLAAEPWPALVRDTSHLLLALKPQVFAEMTAQRPPLLPTTGVISVMGGWSVAHVGQRLGTDRVIRAMPNVGAAVRCSTTAVVIPESVPPQDAAFAMDLFGSVGAVLHVPESLMDTVTAVGASGVAYVCRMIEAMQRGAESLGASPAVARGLALGAADAAVALLRSEPHAQPQQVRERVTSPGGTTAAAMGVLESGGFETLVMQAVQAAQDRARSLDGGISRASGVDEPPRRP